jgi:hypothetical protein
MQLALVVACLLSTGALLSLQLGRLWHLAWWDDDAFLLASFAAAIYAVLTGYRRSRTLHQVLDEVFASDPMAHISSASASPTCWRKVCLSRRTLAS